MGFLFYKEVFLKISDISFVLLLENKVISFKKLTSNPFPPLRKMEFYARLLRIGEIMIRFIHGILREVKEDMLVIEAGGLGYGVRIPASVFDKAPKTGEELLLHTYFSVREDSQELFGFWEERDRDFFIKLLSVSGIGPKTALGILSCMSREELILAIISNDSKKIQQAPGLGKKSAERLIVELRDKVPKEDITFSGEEADMSTTSSVAVEEAVEALVSLGYSAIEAKRWIRSIPAYEEKTAEELLRISLKQFAL